MEGQHGETAAAVRRHGTVIFRGGRRPPPPPPPPAAHATAAAQFHPQRRQAAAVTNAVQVQAEVPVPSIVPDKPAADPEAAMAEKGLNKWGAFDGGSGRGTGSFGFGPLLYHHVDETPQDPFESTRLIMNDPISFNPLSAISWARLDDDPVFEAGTPWQPTHDNSHHPQEFRHGDGNTPLGGEAYSPESSSTSSAASAISGSSSTPSATYSNSYNNTSTIMPPRYAISPPPTQASLLQTYPSSTREVYPPPILPLVPQPPALPPPEIPPHPSPGYNEADFLLCLGPHCNAKFRTEEELHAHFRTEHSFTCNWASCATPNFTSKNALTWHVKAEHLLTCPVPGCCDMHFDDKRLLTAHVRVSIPVHEPTEQPPTEQQTRTSVFVPLSPPPPPPPPQHSHSHQEQWPLNPRSSTETAPSPIRTSTSSPTRHKDSRAVARGALHHQTATATADPRDRAIEATLAQAAVLKRRCRENLRSVIERRHRQARKAGRQHSIYPSARQAALSAAMDATTTTTSTSTSTTTTTDGGFLQVRASPPEDTATICSKTPPRLGHLVQRAPFSVVWDHAVLPFLAEAMPRWCGPDECRIGVERGEVPPAVAACNPPRPPGPRRIRIATLRRGLSRARKLVIAAHVLDLLPSAHRRAVTFSFLSLGSGGTGTRDREDTRPPLD